MAEFNPGSRLGRGRGRADVISAYQREAPTASGFTIRCRNDADLLVIMPSAAFAAGSVYLPDSPSDGFRYRIVASKAILSLTVLSATGTAVTNSPGSVGPRDPIELIYVQVTATWVCISAAAGLPFNPPLAADFTAASSDATLPTLSDSAKNGFLIDTTTISVAGDRYRYAYKALPGSGDWEVIARIQRTSLPTEFWGSGLGAIESGTSKICSIITFPHNSGDPGYIDLRRGTLTAFGADIVGYPQFPAQLDVWFRIVHNSTANTYAYYWSMNGEQWVLIAAAVASATAFTTRADRVAIVTFNSNTTSGDIKLSCPFWWQSY